ncbi:hypothetical protein BGZ58_006619 [Dissophora ornata]|nr:hypothetical protein BGZ58_006619 [Dissophora ornata]
MPDPRVYIPQRQLGGPTPPMMTSQPTRIENTSYPGETVKILPNEQKVLVKEMTTATDAPTKIIQMEKPIAVSTISTVIASEPIHVYTTSPSSTPGAFPVTTNLVRETEGLISRPVVDPKTANGIGSAEGSFLEDQRSVSTKVGSTDGGSARGEFTGSKVDYLREMEHNRGLVAAEDASDLAALDRYQREKYVARYRYPDEEAAHFRDDRRREGERDELEGAMSDDLYEDPYSPTSGEQLSFYDEGEDGLRMEPRRFYDDDESQHSGSIPIQRDRGEYFQSRGRYEEREYDRSYQHYSSSVPTRQQQAQYLSDRELDQAEWTSAALAASETVSLTGYAREQYPAPREYPTRPTLEDRERELELINQKTAASSADCACTRSSSTWDERIFAEPASTTGRLTSRLTLSSKGVHTPKPPRSCVRFSAGQRRGCGQRDDPRLGRTVGRD